MRLLIAALCALGAYGVFAVVCYGLYCWVPALLAYLECL